MTYKITNIEYGIGPWSPEFLCGMVGNPKPGEREDNVHSVTVLQGNGMNILVDTGVDTENPVKKELWDSLITECKGVVWRSNRSILPFASRCPPIAEKWVSSYCDSILRMMQKGFSASFMRCGVGMGLL